MPSVFDHPIDLKDPASLAGNQLVLKLSGTPGGFGVGVGVTVKGESPDENTLDYGELVMPHVASRGRLVLGYGRQVDFAERFVLVCRVCHQRTVRPAACRGNIDIDIRDVQLFRLSSHYLVQR
jgi:hypothetical protein